MFFFCKKREFVLSHSLHHWYFYTFFLALFKMRKENPFLFPLFSFPPTHKNKYVIFFLFCFLHKCINIWPQDKITGLFAAQLSNISISVHMMQPFHFLLILHILVTFYLIKSKNTKQKASAPSSPLEWLCTYLHLKYRAKSEHDKRQGNDFRSPVWLGLLLTSQCSAYIAFSRKRFFSPYKNKVGSKESE